MRTYTLTCPVCRVEHTKFCDFLSSPCSILSTSGNVNPSYSCGIHTAEELHTAWINRAKV